MQSSVGYCGADLKALCAEACLISLRRTFPQVYESTQRLELDVSELNLGRGDFAAALQRVVPASRRSNSSPAAPLEPMAAALLQPFLDCIVDKLGEVFPGFLLKSDVAIKRKRLGAPLGSNEPKRADFSDMWISCLTDVLEEHTLRGLNGDHAECISTTSSACSSTLWSSNSIVSRPRLMVLGEYGGMGQAELSRATLHLLEQFPVFSLDFASLLADGGHFSPEQALVSRVLEAAKAAPSVLYLPDVTSWWRCASDSMRSALMSSAAGADRALPVLWLSTVASDAQACDDDPRLMWLLQWLSGAPGARSMRTFNSQAGQQQIDNLPTDGGVVRLERPSEYARHELFESFFRQLLALPAIIFAARKKMMMSKKRKLTIAAAAPEKTLDNRSPNLVAVLHARPQGPVSLAELLHDQTPPPAQLPFIDIDEARNYMRELRLFMRAALAEMFKEKKLSPLFRPVDPELVPDYYDVITAPMDLDTIRTKVDEDMYPTYRCFYYDLEQIGFNATTYNPLDIKDFRGKQIVHAAKSLLDMVETHAYNFKDRLGYDLFKRCDVIASCPSVLRSVSDHSGQLDTPVFAKALDARVKAKADVKRVRAIMPRENETLYKEILAKHCALKEEMGEEHPSFGKAESQLQKLQEDISSYRNGNCGTSTDRRVSGKDFRANSIDSAVRRSTRGRGSEGGDWRSFFMALEVEEQSSNKRKRRNEVDDRDIGVGDVNNELEDLVENDLAEVQVVDTAKGEEATYLDKITMSNSAENVEDIAAESADEFEIGAICSIHVLLCVNISCLLCRS